MALRAVIFSLSAKQRSSGCVEWQKEESSSSLSLLPSCASTLLFLLCFPLQLLKEVRHLHHLVVPQAVALEPQRRKLHNTLCCPCTLSLSHPIPTHREIVKCVIDKQKVNFSFIVGHICFSCNVFSFCKFYQNVIICLCKLSAISAKTATNGMCLQ